jgi:hypothetical protein
MLRAQDQKAATFRRKVGFLEVGGLLYFLNMTKMCPACSVSVWDI